MSKKSPLTYYQKQIIKWLEENGGTATFKVRKSPQAINTDKTPVEITCARPTLVALIRKGLIRCLKSNNYKLIKSNIKEPALSGIKHPTMPEMINVSSSHIAQIGYDGNDLFVKFKTGKTYKYLDVPREMYDRFKHAPSLGSSLHRDIIPNYAVIKMQE